MKKLLLPIVLCCSSWLAPAQEPLPDVRLLIDVSGSMRDSDPQNLREPALELMVQLLPEGSRAGVWTFGQWVNMVVAHGDVDDAWRESAVAAVNAISNHGLLTNIPDAMELATFDIERLGYQYRTSLIVLTDGKVEVSGDDSDNRRAARDLLNKVAPALREWGVEVHTIALSDNADWEFLQALAQATGGLAERAQSAEELSAVFLQALDIAAPTEQVPLLGGEFLIDDSVDEFTVLVFPDEATDAVSLVRPDGSRFDRQDLAPGTNWYHHERFELITVSEPAVGEWRVVAPGSRTRVNVLSHLGIVLDRPPTNLPSGKLPQIGLQLTDGDQVITDPQILELVTATVKVYRADDTQWELVLEGADVGADGEFRTDLAMLAQAGRYEIVVNVDGRSFQRETTFLTDVIDPPPQVDPADLIPAQEPSAGVPGWLVPAGISLLLLLGLAAWWIRRGRDDEWYDDDEEYLDEQSEDEEEDWR